jgi:hypothetical protein
MKGQYFSFDAVIGASIFILTLIAIMSYWYGISNSIEQQQSILAKEAMRIADIIYSPQEIPYGLALSWNDKHLNASKIDGLCHPLSDPSVALGSAYLVSVKFKSVETDGTTDCTWGDEKIVSNSIYRMRRTASLYNEDGTTERAYVDVYVYEPAPDTP